MANKNQILVFIISFLIAGFFLLSTPEAGFSQPGEVCCEGITGIGTVCLNAFQCNVNTDGTACESETECTDQNRLSPCTCTPETGACCFPTGVCVDEITADDCVNEGGDYQGDGTNCGEVMCPQPPSIPTLNQWGMIIMAAVLGLFAVIGIIVMRRRNVVMPSN